MAKRGCGKMRLPQVKQLPDSLPIGTYGESLQLVETMEGWRGERPVIHQESCNQCGWCYLVCPEGTVYKEGAEIKIDLRFCKGCGICARECRRGCIQMEVEKGDA